jgi:hypothetical protein
VAINSFCGNTFVAYVDIAGFKSMVREGERAWRVLNKFYQTGYDVLRTEARAPDGAQVEGFFISDCGVLFVRSLDVAADNKIGELDLLLNVVKTLNERMLGYRVMLTTSISYGEFRFNERVEFPGIEKRPLYGYAYIEAFRDSEDTRNRIQPGQCRILAKGIPQPVRLALSRGNRTFRLVRRNANVDREHYYFYWMLHERGQIDDFNKAYSEAASIVYAEQLRVLREGPRARTHHDIQLDPLLGGD